MSKEEFWKKFFLSPYYDENRMKKIGTITDRPDDIFKQQCKGIDLGPFSLSILFILNLIIYYLLFIN